jgi:hypothetical protein
LKAHPNQRHSRRQAPSPFAAAGRHFQFGRPNSQIFVDEQACLFNFVLIESTIVPLKGGESNGT